MLVCDGPSCGVTHESELLVERLRKVIVRDPDLAARVTVCSYTCFGHCDDGPNMFVHALANADVPGIEPNVAMFSEQRGFYRGMNEEIVLRILEQHCGRGEVVDDLVSEY